MAKRRDLYAVEKMVARVLQWGVGLSVSLLASGWALSLLGRGTEFASAGRRDEFLGAQVEFPRSFAALWDGLGQMDGRAIMMLGLGVLILTPLARVLSSLVVFISLRDRLYSALTAAVVALLALSLYLGKIH